MRRTRCGSILQGAHLLRESLGEEIVALRKHLTELDERGTQLLDRLAQPGRIALAWPQIITCGVLESEALGIATPAPCHGYPRNLRESGQFVVA